MREQFSRTYQPRRQRLIAAWFIADISIHDPDGYQVYIAGVIETFERYGGKLKAVSSAQIDVIEGDRAPEGRVILEFPTRAQAKAGKVGPDCVELEKIRKATAETNMVPVDGL